MSMDNKYLVAVTYFCFVNPLHKSVHCSLFSDVMEFITNARGNPIIKYGNIHFNMDSRYKNAQKKRWRCSKHYQGCKATIVTIDDNPINCKMEHQHW